MSRHKTGNKRYTSIMHCKKCKFVATRTAHSKIIAHRECKELLEQHELDKHSGAVLIQEEGPPAFDWAKIVERGHDV